MQRILVVPVDGSEQSKKALDFAAELAVHYRAQLKLIYITQPYLVEDIFAMSTIPVPVDIENTGLEKFGAEVLEKAKAIAVSAGATDLSDEILQGDPARAILDYADEVDADMIIIGTRGMGDFSSLMLGSVSHKVAHDAKCTCITVK